LAFGKSQRFQIFRGDDIECNSISTLLKTRLAQGVWPSKYSRYFETIRARTPDFASLRVRS
jgi:hypothetical protein